MDKSQLKLMAALVLIALAIIVRVLVFPWLFPPATVAEAGPADLERAAAGALPYVAKLGSESCVYCRQMNPILAELAQRYQEQVIFFDVDLTKHPELAGRYGVRLIPTTVFFAVGGVVVHIEVGFLDAEAITTLMRQHGLIN